ncbi:Uma2 family endonuclease [Thermomicrobiaceae bacterium CFH 74404]|uniref:Uma2 family endonuclease n=1 Tax=Thermalbibacter longus TaxID=2951981 RepID=A0AA41WH23_9BACT|nr:Uma2 family endonuclease [Thermalbibacter longus]MCM8749968.1 Uma2 family endonuclease [Thermalbibacter longus]
MAVHALKHRFTVSEYRRMVEAGIFGEDDRVELLEGEIVQMSPIGSRHAACVARLTTLLARLHDRAIPWVQNPVVLGEYSELQPDITLLRFREDFYAQTLPGPHDVLLLIEVADSSVEYDQEIKVPLYSRAGVAEVWLVNLVQQRVTVYGAPSPVGYQEVRVATPGETVSPRSFPELEISVGELLG